MSATRVGLVGGGSIGTGWAIVFARAGMTVTVCEPWVERRLRIVDDVRDRVEDLAGAGLLDDPVEAVVARIAVTDDLGAALADAAYVQESGPEDLGLKQELLARVDALTPAGVPIGSSSSAITASRMAEDLPGRARVLVVHPANPPYLLPVAEVVPAPFTAEDAVDRTFAVLRLAGMLPVRVRREVEGFVYNRLQGAVLREAYCLVRDGVVDAPDLDVLVREGLGLRWSVVGPFATSHLNVRGGLRAHAARMADSYARMGAERGQDDPWTPDLVARVAEQVEERLPVDRWDDLVRQRDQALMRAVAARRGEPRVGDEAERESDRDGSA